METMRPSIRPLKPDSPQKTQQMARPFEVPPSGVLPQKLTVPRGINSMMDIGFQNRYAALADYPRLQATIPTKLINQKIEQGTTSSSKRIPYIISWNFAKTKSDRIKYLSKEIKIRGWTPKVISKTPVKVSPKAASTSPSKNVLKERLKKALKEMDDDQSNEEDIMLLLEEVMSEKDNGDMLDPTGIASAYLDSY
uniref:Uncharacterized protein n=1 Tax=Solanum tuberosum TaxID=4113 RepID=M1DMF7_SOLTU